MAYNKAADRTQNRPYTPRENREPREGATHKPQNNARYIRSRVFELNDRFREVTRGWGSNARGSKLHAAQVDYCYLINEATNGPEYIAPKFLLKAELLISSIEVERAAEAEKKAAEKARA